MSRIFKYTLLSFLFFTTLLSFAQEPVFVLAGGGAEGDVGDTNSWSYRLYGRLFDHGDLNGDGVVKLVVLSDSLPSRPADARWLPDYFQWLGAQRGLNVVAENLAVASRSDAENAGLTAVLNDADALFIRGGDQGVYYDAWNNTLLEDRISAVAARGGGLGGTSAGAMSLCRFSFSGGRDLVAADVMADSHTSYLNDAGSPSTSGIHDDFFPFVNALVDTHFTQRGRLGRLVGLLAKANEDFARNDILGIGLEMDTGLVISGDMAEVVGTGSVSFIRETVDTDRVRVAGEPLFYTNLVLDRLTEGWRFSLGSRGADGSAVIGVAHGAPTAGDRANSGALSIAGSAETDAQRFGYTASFYPDDYQPVAGSGTPYIKDSLGFCDVGNTENRMDKHESLFHLLYDRPGDLGILAFSGAVIERVETAADILTFSGESGVGSAVIVISGLQSSARGLSPYPSNWATTGGSLRAAAHVGLTLHVLSYSEARGVGLNSRTHQPVALDGGPGDPGGDPDVVDEIEPNDSTSTAQLLNLGEAILRVRGTIDHSGDRDYFELSVAPGESLTVDLQIPAGVDYDLYLLDRRGRTLIRSVNDGAGLSESLNWVNDGRRDQRIYVSVEPWSGSDPVNPYQLSIQ